MDYHVLWPYDQVTNYLENMILFLKNYCGAPGGPAFAIFATIAHTRLLNFSAPPDPPNMSQKHNRPARKSGVQQKPF